MFIKKNISGLLVLVLMVSCSGDEAYETVDFSKRVDSRVVKQQVNREGQLRVAVAAMISPKETFDYYTDLIMYLGDKLDRKVVLVQRKTYEEINELFPEGKVDLAFICSGPYALTRQKFKFQAIATPVVRGSPFYQSYLIVNKRSKYSTLSDLRQGTFAFTDPGSNTGSLVPHYWLQQLGEMPETFFRRTNYTFSHDNSILSVARSLVDGAAVDGHKWEYFRAGNDPVTEQTRVIRKSMEFGSPPIVVSEYLSTELRIRIQSRLLTMHLDEQGKQLLKKLLIDRFVEPEEDWYEPIREIREVMQHARIAK